MADGSERPIKDVNVGDKVLSTDPKTGASKAEGVTALHRNTDHDFSDVTVKDQNGRTSVLNTTQNHPFWNETDKKWSDAKNLKPGDRLKVAGGGNVIALARQATGGGNVYEICGDCVKKGVDVNKALGGDNVYSHEREIAVPGRIDPSCIVSCTLPNGRVIPNPNYGK